MSDGGRMEHAEKRSRLSVIERNAPWPGMFLPVTSNVIPIGGMTP